MVNRARRIAAAGRIVTAAAQSVVMSRKLLEISLASLVAASSPAQVTWWDKDLDAALTAAADAPAGMLMLYCWKDSVDCSAMFSGTMSDAQVTGPLADFVCMGAKDDEAGKAAWERYKVQSVPTVLFIDPNGDVVDSVIGYATIVDFTANLKRVRAGEDTITALQTEVDGGASTLPRMQLLMQKLLRIQEPERAMTVIDAMIAKDPRTKSAEAAEAMLWKITSETLGEDVAPKDLDVAPLRRFLKGQRNKRVQFLGYDRMAQAHWERGEVKEAASYADKAWKSIPRERVIEWGQRMTGFAYRNWKVLEKTNKAILKNALKVSKATLKAIEKQDKKQPDPAFLANAMGLHAAILVVNKKRKEALDLMDDAIALAPENPNLKAWKANWLQGNK
ncbi:MAG: hypothetical protein CMJ88_02975 [Planctomycetes bacterium]|nr:hypothetical protein [Planctomycetota bacterium]